MLSSRTTCSSKIFKYPFAVLAETPTSYILMLFFVKNAVLGFGLGLGLGFNPPLPRQKKFTPTLVPRFTYSRFRNTKKHPKYLGFLLLTVIAGLKTPLPRGCQVIREAISNHVNKRHVSLTSLFPLYLRCQVTKVGENFGLDFEFRDF